MSLSGFGKRRMGRMVSSLEKGLFGGAMTLTQEGAGRQGEGKRKPEVQSRGEELSWSPVHAVTYPYFKN